MSLPKVPVGSSNLRLDMALSYFCPTTTYSRAVNSTTIGSCDVINSQIVRLFATVPAYITIGAGPFTASPDCPIGASVEYLFYVPEGQKVGFIRFGSSDGTIYISSVLTA